MRRAQNVVKVQGCAGVRNIVKVGVLTLQVPLYGGSPLSLVSATVLYFLIMLQKSESYVSCQELTSVVFLLEGAEKDGGDSAYCANRVIDRVAHSDGHGLGLA